MNKIERGKRPMTPKMMKLLQFIKNYTKKYKYSPTFSEMAKEMGPSLPTLNLLFMYATVELA